MSQPEMDRIQHNITRYSLLLLMLFLCVMLPVNATAVDLVDLEAIVDDARLTLARFVGDPKMAWFRERAKKARAVFIAPHVARAGYFFGGSWGSGVLLVRDSSTGQWSQPAFYRITGLSFGLQIGALRSELVALATDDRAADEMVDGAFTLGVKGTVGIGSYGGGLSGSIETVSRTGFLSVESPTGLFAGVAAGGTLVFVRDAANERYYGQPVELKELRENLARQWYSDRLIKMLTDLSASGEDGLP
jgi:lipid-binding SYLF domain-containing protein